MDVSHESYLVIAIIKARISITLTTSFLQSQGPSKSLRDDFLVLDQLLPSFQYGVLNLHAHMQAFSRLGRFTGSRYRQRGLGTEAVQCSVKLPLSTGRRWLAVDAPMAEFKPVSRRTTHSWDPTRQHLLR